MKETSRIPAEELEAIRRAQDPPQGFGLLVYLRESVSFVPLGREGPVVLGRDPPPGPGAVAIPDPGLSREHARFSHAGGTVKVVDLGSKNGTWLLGQRVEQAELAPGDEVRLSGVPVLVHGDAALRSALRPLSHERFRLALEDEVVRARHFRRPFTLVMLRAEGRPAPHVSSFHQQVSARLRPVDRIAFYSPDALEILLPETSLEEAVRLADELAAQRGAGPALLAGVAAFPDAAPEPEALLEACRMSLISAGVGDRGRVVAAGSRRSERRGRASAADSAPILTSASVRAVFGQVEALARSSIPVLILGETGVGKEVLAQRIHTQSPRRGKPLVVVNCAAIPESLVESTLFGHQRGAFTGAMQMQKGLFESADGGTLMLDEVGELPRTAQAALLRVLETSRVRRVGASDEIEVDVRILAATHRDLEAMCERNEFRSDLLYRLSGVSVTLPPLRERVEDIDPLCAAFLQRASEANGLAVPRIEPRAVALLQAYPWPGNVRELRNAIERAVVLARSDVITCDDLPERVRSVAPRSKPPEPHRSAPPPSPRGDAPAASSPPATPAPAATWEVEDASEGDDLRSQVARYEAHIILEALNASGGNQKAAAASLGLPLRTLIHKMKSLGIRRAPYVRTASRGKPRG
ncbi:sigma 54-interacting transcriptional regulator [Sorangium sp. So ce118]